MSNELEVYKSAPLPALMNDPRAIIEAIQVNMDGAPVSESNLTKIKVPSGGSTFFTVPTLGGEEAEKALVGTVVFHRPGRVYYSTPFSDAGDDDRFPDCYSDTGTIGHGNPGGNCDACPMNQFGSASRNGKQTQGKACSERKTLYILRGEQMMPDVVSVPPSSLKALNQFLFKLSTSGIKYYEALISITLERVKSGDGIDYAEARFAFVRKLSEQEAQHSGMWQAMMRALAEDTAKSRLAQIQQRPAA